MYTRTLQTEWEGLGDNSQNSTQGWGHQSIVTINNHQKLDTKSTSRSLRYPRSIQGMILTHPIINTRLPVITQDYPTETWQTMKMHASSHILKATAAWHFREHEYFVSMIIISKLKNKCIKTGPEEHPLQARWHEQTCSGTFRNTEPHRPSSLQTLYSSAKKSSRMSKNSCLVWNSRSTWIPTRCCPLTLNLSLSASPQQPSSL